MTDLLSHPRARSRHPVAAAGIVALGLFGASWAVAHAVTDDGSPRSDDQPLDVAQIWTETSDAERDYMFEGSTDGQRQAMEGLFDRAASDGLLPVAEPFGGYVSVDILQQATIASSRADLFPVFDDAGGVIAYWGVGLGPVDKQLVESEAPLDFEQLRADSGRRTDGEAVVLTD